MLRALGSRNYRLFFFGQVVSLVGTWITRVATSWLVYRLTDTKFGFWICRVLLHLTYVSALRRAVREFQPSAIISFHSLMSRPAWSAANGIPSGVVVTGLVPLTAKRPPASSRSE